MLASQGAKNKLTWNNKGWNMEMMRRIVHFGVMVELLFSLRGVLPRSADITAYVPRSVLM